MTSRAWDETAQEEWKRHGVFHGRMTPEEWKTGGFWLIGSAWPDNYPGKTDRVFYKSWCTWPEKYIPGAYPKKNRVAENEWEFVQVIDGCLECWVEDEGGTKLFPLEHMECVDVRPEPIRYWQFAPKKEQFASGIAFFRRNLPASPLQPGAGEGYEFRLWKEHQLERLSRSVNLSPFSVQFVEIFNGQLEARVSTLTQETRTYTLNQQEYLFLDGGVTVEWIPQGNPFGIVVYLA